MSKIDSTPVTKQPVIHGIYNTFGIMGNEKLVYEGTKENRRCGCANIYHTTLTDARLLIRTEQENCCSRSQNNYDDISIFLRDIALIRQSTELRENSECCICCIRCCRSTKILNIRGVFGSKILHIPVDDLNNLQYEIPIQIANHKLISHH